jgi:hypothetical protein
VAKNYEKYGVGAPPLPFKKLQTKMAGLEAGNPLLITAATGTGKSLMLLHLALYYVMTSEAWRVVYMTHETTPRSFQGRIFARTMGIPSYCFKKPFQAYGVEREFAPLDFQDPFWQPAYEHYSSTVVGRAKDRIEFIPMRQAGIKDIVNEIRRQSEIARAYGQQLIVFEDYIQKWNIYDLIVGKRMDLAYGRAIDEFKDVCMDVGAYAVLASQTNRDSNTGDPKAKEASNINDKLQMHLHLQSEKLPDTAPPDRVALSVDGQITYPTNFLGYQRRYNSDKYSGSATLTSIKSNDSDVGTQAEIKIERPHLMVYDEGEPPVQYDMTIYDLLKLNGEL